jgi:hypothetical protein
MATLGGKVLLFGGWAASGDLGDTWEWDGTTWSEMTPANGPQAQANHVMATLGSKVVLLGRGETWEWDGTTWTEKTPATTPQAGVMATASGRVVLLVLFSASYDQPERPGETWEWNGTSWAEKRAATAPSARFGHAMATLGTKIVLFGGSAMKHPLGDTWVMEALASAE